MPLIAKRKLTQTWREAVARQGRDLGVEAECLRSFDECVAKGEPEAIAAYRSLARFGALFLVAEPSSGESSPQS